VLSQFSGRLGAARRAYERFIWEEKGGEHQEEYHMGSEADSRILGDETFIDRVLSQKEAAPRRKVKLEGVLREVCKRYSVKEKDLGAGGKDRRLSEARGMAAWLIMEIGVCPLRELGKVTGRDVTTLSSAMKRLQMRAKTDLRLAKAMNALFEAIS
jgi:chromosomal replication initiation ATPase DnaA